MPENQVNDSADLAWMKSTPSREDMTSGATTENLCGI